MLVFEFHFNPKTKEDLIFDSFCFEPENIYEKRVGSLYMLGLLKNVLPQNIHFLERLARVIKEKFYSSTLVKPEKSLKNSLKEANDFLENIAKRGDVSWLGNLSFGVISLKNFELNFTKVGDLKFLLLRRGGVLDIDQKLKLEDFEPYPLKIFGNIISGKLAENDILLALTNKVYETFQSQSISNEIARIKPFDEKKLGEVLKTKNDLLSKISGICLLIYLTSKETAAGKRETISPQPREFSLKEIFRPITLRLKGLIKKPRLEFKKGFKLKLPRVSWAKKLKVPKFTFPKLNKNLILVLVLIFFLALGWVLTQREEKQQLEKYQATLNEIQETQNQAQTFLILAKTNPQAEKEARFLLKESWEKISPLSKIASTLPQNFNKEIISLKENISKNLYQLNKLEIIEEPETIFEFSPKNFIPQKLVIFEKELYFFSPYSQNLFKVNLKGEGQLIQINQKFSLAVALDNSISFFSKPNQLTILKGGDFSQFTLETSPDSNYEHLSSYKSNLYFFDKNSGEIIKYSYRGNLEWEAPQLWLAFQAKKATDSKSMAINGSVWLLNRDNSLSRYYGGWPQETITLDIFPSPKNFSKIFTSPTLPYLYLLEPEQNRIVILNKSGQVVKQFQSEKFDNLLDFAVSSNAKTIYLLNGQKVYRIPDSIF